MAIDMNRFKSLSDEDKRKWIEQLERDHRETRAMLDNAKRMYTAKMSDDKTSANDAATLIRHYDECKQQLKELDKDMEQVSAYQYDDGATGTDVCYDKDPYLALNTILSNGTVNIRPDELCQHAAIGSFTYQQIRENRKIEKEAEETRKWVARYNEFKRSTKKEELPEPKERLQKEQKLKGAE